MNDDFYTRVHEANDPTPSGPYGWIQWKGTSVCMDTHCVCGYRGHFDGEFFYFYECPACHARYAVGMNVKLIPLTPEFVESAVKNKQMEEDSFKSDVDHWRQVANE